MNLHVCVRACVRSHRLACFAELLYKAIYDTTLAWLPWQRVPVTPHKPNLAQMILSTEEKMGCNHSAAHIPLDVLLAALRKTWSKAELCLPSLFF